MYKSLVPFLACFLIIVTDANAGRGDSYLYEDTSSFELDEVRKPWTVGAGFYSNVISYNDTALDDDRFTGFALSGAYAVNDIFAFRVTYFNQKETDNSSLKSSGLDILAHVGSNMGTEGFKIYAGGGVFRDRQEIDSFSETFDGLQLSGGVGYNWESFAVDFILNLRQTGDYEDALREANPGSINLDTELGIASGNLLFSMRF